METIMAQFKKEKLLVELEANEMKILIEVFQ